MSEQEQRALVVAEARKWVNTPYHSCADILGVGCDCGMLIVRAFVDSGLTPPFDPRPYSSDWHLHRSEERYLGFVGDRCALVEEPQPGDVAMFMYGRCYSHGGIITGASPVTMIHAFKSSHCVVEEELARNPQLNNPKRKVLFYSFWAK